MKNGAPLFADAGIKPPTTPMCTEAPQKIQIRRSVCPTASRFMGVQRGGACRGHRLKVTASRIPLAQPGPC
eukprot:6002490-Heterocapsa_arctica.AAC.1